MPQQGKVGQVAGSDLVGGCVQLGEKIGARDIECRRKESDADFAGITDQFLVFRQAKLDLFAVLAIGVRIAVAMDVGAVIHLLREQRAVVALLELDRVGSAFQGDIEHLLALFEVALMVMTDLGDNVAVATVTDRHAIERQLSYHDILPCLTCCS
ncbi:hypothetical protein BMS3Bbin10_00233 [bacterium BMS3Bbin10]|nr:hypothetical protein BMS3Bbin10_00233 [bacterium BMS3Bbin10]